MINRLVICAALIVVATKAKASDKVVELGKTFENYKVIKPGGDFQISLVRIGDKKNEEVLMKISGVDDTLSNKIYKYKKQWLNSDKSLKKWKYCTKEVPQWFNKEWCPLHSNSSWGYASMKYYLFDDENTELPVSFTPGSDSNLDPALFHKQYLKQIKEESSQRKK